MLLNSGDIDTTTPLILDPRDGVTVLAFQNGALYGVPTQDDLFSTFGEGAYSWQRMDYTWTPEQVNSLPQRDWSQFSSTAKGTAPLSVFNDTGTRGAIDGSLSPTALSRATIAPSLPSLTAVPRSPFSASADSTLASAPKAENAGVNGLWWLLGGVAVLYLLK